MRYCDYYWEEGLPKGWGAAPKGSTSGVQYAVVSDPYQKRYSVEKFVEGAFDEVVYDSALFDFRHLKGGQHASWEKLGLDEKRYLLRDHYGRAVVIERYTFVEGRCVGSHAYHPMGTPLSSQLIFYRSLGAPFDGVLLYDSTGRPIVCKEYAVDPISGEFSDLLSEQWKLTPSTENYKSYRDYFETRSSAL